MDNEKKPAGKGVGCLAAIVLFICAGIYPCFSQLHEHFGVDGLVCVPAGTAFVMLATRLFTETRMEEKYGIKPIKGRKLVTWEWALFYFALLVLQGLILVPGDPGIALVALLFFGSVLYTIHGWLYEHYRRWVAKILYVFGIAGPYNDPQPTGVCEFFGFMVFLFLLSELSAINKMLHWIWALF